MVDVQNLPVSVLYFWFSELVLDKGTLQLQVPLYSCEVHTGTVEGAQDRDFVWLGAPSHTLI